MRSTRSGLFAAAAALLAAVAAGALYYGFLRSVPVPEGAAVRPLYGIFLLIFLVVEHLRAPSVPDLKPFLLLPFGRGVLLRKVIEGQLTGLGRLFYFLPLLAVVAAFALRLHSVAAALGEVALFGLLYGAIVLSAWQTGLCLRYESSRRALLRAVSVTGLVAAGVILTFFPVGLPLVLLIGGIVSGLVLLVLWRNVNVLLRAVFAATSSPSTRTIRASRSTRFLFLQKELRMCVRSRRLRHAYFIALPLCLLIAVVGFFVAGKKPLDFFLYLIFVALPLGGFNEYFEKFWAWDRQGEGLILSMPGGRKRYFSGKLLYAALLGLLPLVLHLALFSDRPAAAAVAGVLMACAVPTAAGYRSMTKADLQVELHAKISDLKRSSSTLHFGATMAVLLLGNWFILLRNGWMPEAAAAAAALYVAGVLGGTVVLLQRLWKAFHQKDWRTQYGH